MIVECYLEWVMSSGLGDSKLMHQLASLYMKNILHKEYGMGHLPSSFQHNEKYKTKGREEIFKKWITFHTSSIIPWRKNWLISFCDILPDQGNSQPSSHPSSSSPSSSPASESLPLYVKKLQGLLSCIEMFSSNDKRVARDVVELIKAEEDCEIKGKVSILLLCFPHYQLVDAVQLITQFAPNLSSDFGLEYCHSPSDWSLLLHSLLSLSSPHHNNNNNDNNINIIDNNINRNNVNKIDYYKEYEKLLNTITESCDTETLLSLLPADGNIDYYLPFIKRSFFIHKSKSLRNDIVNERKNSYLASSVEL